MIYTISRSFSLEKTREVIMRTVLSAVILAVCCSAMPAGEFVWFRTNGLGRYPDATPLTEWGINKNVVWKTPMAKWGNATPVISGGKIFICAEPATILCINKADGTILWQAENTYEALAGSDDEKKKIAAAQKEAKALTDQMNPLNRERQKVSRELRKDKGNAELKAKMEALNKKLQPLNKQMQQLAAYILPKTHDVNGYSSATPVTDGTSVYAVFGNGIVTAFTVDGKRLWHKKIESPPNSWGFSMSPLLAGGLLLAHINTLHAFDPKTGEEKWNAKAKWGWGTSAPATIGGKDVIFTGKGQVVNLSDGSIFKTRLPQHQFNGPIVYEGVVYYIETKPQAFSLDGIKADEAHAKPLWTGSIKNDRYYGTPLIHEDLIYVITQNRHLSVIDRETGKTVYEKAVDISKATAYPSLTLGGKYIFLSNEKGNTVIFKPGRTYEEIARNNLEAFRTCPVFEGSRMYIRAAKNFYCIGK